MNKARVIIEKSLNYIEKHLKEKLILEDIAKNVGVSKYHLHRIFKCLTGETIINYATSRKLASSINELLNTNLKIIDIALEYGFEYEQSYIRAFQKEYGRTPLKIRNCREAVLLKEKIDLNDLISVEEAVTYRPFFVMKPAFDIIGIKHLVPIDADYLTANRLARDFFYHQSKLIKNTVNPHIYLGYINWAPFENGYTIYMPSVEVSRIEEVPDGMTGFSIPTHKYAVFRFVGFFHPDRINVKHFSHILEYMYSKWITQGGYDVAGEFRLEYIDSSIAKDDYCEFDLYQPVKEKDKS